MDVIASTAFGMDIDAQSSTNHPFINHARTFFGIPNKRSKFLQSFIFMSICKFTAVCILTFEVVSYAHCINRQLNVFCLIYMIDDNSACKVVAIILQILSNNVKTLQTYIFSPAHKCRFIA